MHRQVAAHGRSLAPMSGKVRVIRDAEDASQPLASHNIFPKPYTPFRSRHFRETVPHTGPPRGRKAGLCFWGFELSVRKEKSPKAEPGRLGALSPAGPEACGVWG